MRTVCAWCDAVIKEGDETKIEGTSHGICKDCLAVIMAEMDAENAAEDAATAMAEASLEAELAEAQEALDNAAPADTPTGERIDR